MLRNCVNYCNSVLVSEELERRGIEPNERVFLRDKAIVTEMQCDLGLTAIRADLVHDLMAKDYPQKYKVTEK